MPPSGTGTPSVIVFSPSAVMLNNPAHPGATGAPPTFTVNLTAYASNGNVLPPTTANPLHVNVYGAPKGVITPVETELTSGTAVQFTYNGGYFPNNMEVASWINEPSVGAALGTTLFVQQNRPACTGSNNFDLAMVSTVPDAIRVKAVVGADNPQGGDFKIFTIDTGSLGVLVTKQSLVIGPNVHGPGAAGQKFYDSSGYIFTGNYYLAPVSVELSDGTYVQTNPILVLAIDGVHCDISYTQCKKPTHADLHYLGVGFDRNSTTTDDLFDSPSENAFLQLTDPPNVTYINQGYILSTVGVTLGITAANSSGFNLLQLDTNSDGVPGDWNAIPGCYGFPKLPGSPQFCGNLLLDVGIDQMYIDAPSDEWPPLADGSQHLVPDKVRMNIQAGLPGQPPVMSYGFKAVQPPEQPTDRPQPTSSGRTNPLYSSTPAAGHCLSSTTSTRANAARLVSNRSQIEVARETVVEQDYKVARRRQPQERT